MLLNPRKYPRMRIGPDRPPVPFPRRYLQCLLPTGELFFNISSFDILYYIENVS
jgi:hypothetical protein